MKTGSPWMMQDLIHQKVEGLNEGRGDDHGLDVSLTEYRPEYPDYYPSTIIL